MLEKRDLPKTEKDYCQNDCKKREFSDSGKNTMQLRFVQEMGAVCRVKLIQLSLFLVSKQNRWDDYLLLSTFGTSNGKGTTILRSAFGG